MTQDRTGLIWDDAKAFLAIARSGSLTAATRILGGGIATTSRRIERLEAALGVPLFIRHQSGYRLSDEGEALLPKAEALEDAARAFDAQANKESEAIGRVRLATAENFATHLIIPSLPAFFAKHPLVELDITTDISTVNLHRREADLALRMVKPDRGHVTVRRIGTLGFGVYGSASYMAARKTGDTTTDFGNDRFIGWPEAYNTLPAALWLQRILHGRQPILTTTTLAAQVQAATAGLGLAVLPHFLTQGLGLIHIPTEIDADQPIWLVIHTDLATSRRVRAVADHLAHMVHEQRHNLTDPHCP